MVEVGKALEEMPEGVLRQSMWGYRIGGLYGMEEPHGSTLAENAADQLVDGWSHLTETMHEETTLIQAAAQDIFGIESPHLDERLSGHPEGYEPQHDWGTPSGLREYAWNKFSQDDMDVTKAGLAAMYENTQTMLREAGIKEVTLYRGVENGVIPYIVDETSDSGYTLPSRATTTANPVSSWSLSEDTARMFANIESGSVMHYEGGGAVLVATFPADRIFSTPKTGLGCLSEAEVVVLGGQKDSVSIRGREDYDDLVDEVGEAEDDQAWNT